jgi:hypothetical protein
VTDSTLRYVKERVYGIGRSMPILGFYNDAGTLYCWAYAEDGSFIREVSSVTLPATASGFESRLLQRIVHTPAGPFLTWAGGDGTHQWVLVWDILHDSLGGSLVATSTDIALGCPLLPVGASSYLYFLLSETGAGLTHLYRVAFPSGGSPELVTADSVSAHALGYFRLCPAYDDAYVYGFGGLGSDIWRWSLAGGGQSEKVPNESNLLIPHYSQLYRAGSDATYDYWFGSDGAIEAGADHFGKQILVKRNRSSGRFYPYMSAVGPMGVDPSAATFATAAPSIGATVHSTINIAGDVSGYFPWDDAAGHVIKLGQPMGDVTVDGNDGEPPTVTLEAVGGLYPHVAHLCALTHVWS